MSKIGTFFQELDRDCKTLNAIVEQRTKRDFGHARVVDRRGSRRLSPVTKKEIEQRNYVAKKVALLVFAIIGVLAAIAMIASGIGVGFAVPTLAATLGVSFGFFGTIACMSAILPFALHVAYLDD